jgi:transcription factor TFIIIB component B''
VRKESKITPLAVPTSISAPGTLSSTLQSPDANSRPTSQLTHPTEVLLQNATSQAATVSALADVIDGNTASARQSSRKRKATGAGTAESHDASESRQPRRSKRPRTREFINRSPTAEIIAEVVGEGANASPRRKRKQPPEGAENHEIKPSEVKMAELCKDAGLGKKSQREAKMEMIDWDAVKKRRKEEALEAQRRREAHEKDKTIATRQPNSFPPVGVNAEMEIGPDGEIRVVDSSREVDRQAEALQRAENGDQVVIEEDAVTKRVNQLTVGRPKGVAPGTRWDEEMEERFYKGLRMFGTDFMMISSMFPGMTRRHIKLKYVKEEKTNIERIHYNLANREQVDLSEYEKMTDKVYDDPKKVQEQIEAEEKRLREEDQQRRALEDGEPHPDEDTVLESREKGSPEPADQASEREDTAGPARDESLNENRFASVARGIVQEATISKKRRKQTGPVKKKDARKGKRPMEGVEERLGPIDEVTR